MKIEVALTGHEVNGWPTACIEVNGQTIYDGEIIGECSVLHEQSNTNDNVLTIRHYGKHDATILDNDGNIVADRYFNIDYIKIDDLELGLDFFSDQQIVFVTENGQEKITSYVGENGKMTFKFPYPLWKLWGESKIPNKINNLAD